MAKDAPKETGLSGFIGQVKVVAIVALSAILVYQLIGLAQLLLRSDASAVGSVHITQGTETRRVKKAPAAVLVTVTVFTVGGNNTGTQGFTISFDRKDEDAIMTVATEAWKGLGKTLPAEVRLCNATGATLLSLDAVENGDFLYVIAKSDLWVWPGQYIGHRIKLPHVPSSTGQELWLETVSLTPRLFLIENFLSDDEMAAIREAAGEQLVRSKVYQYGEGANAGEGSYDESQVRTSEQTWIDASDSEIGEAIETRVQALTRVPRELFEHIQVLRYRKGQFYEAHYDYFDPALFPTYEALNNGRNRFITVFFYLSDVQEGGETFFIRAGPTGWGMAQIYNYKDCSRGLKVQPKKGRAIMFYSLLADGHMAGALDPMSMHGGCPVLEGEKWAANQWVYNKPLGS